MTTPRAHADLAKLYYSDKEMQCWEWDKVMRTWRTNPLPWFSDEKIYHVGKVEPTEPPQIMCELAGVKFPMPVQIEPKLGVRYYVADLSFPQDPSGCIWDNYDVDQAHLDTGAVQLTEEGAIQQSLAMRAALKQAIEKAKEQIK